MNIKVKDFLANYCLANRFQSFNQKDQSLVQEMFGKYYYKRFLDVCTTIRIICYNFHDYYLTVYLTMYI